MNRLISLTLLSFLFVFQAHAADLVSIDQFGKGKQAFAVSNYSEAYDHFYQAFLHDPTNKNINFYLARSAFEKGDYETAVMAYERILLQDPEASRVKLELARTYYKLKSYEMAKQYFKEVLATNPPEAVWSNIKRFITSIDEADKRHFFNGMVTVGLSYDDNIRTAPTGETVNTIIGDITLTGNTATPIKNYLLNTTAVLNHIYRFDNKKYTWKTNITNYNAFNETAKDLDINFLGLSTGLVYQKEKFLLQGNAIGNQVDLGYDHYLGTFGVGGSATYVNSQKMLLTLNATLQEKNFYLDEDKDSTNFNINGGPIFNLGKTRISFTLGREIESAETEQNSYQRTSASLRCDQILPHDFNLYASVRIQDTGYQGIEALFGKTRSDKSKDLSCGLSKTLWNSKDKSNSIIGQISNTYTDIKSNCDIYTYRKNVTATSLTYTF